MNKSVGLGNFRRHVTLKSSTINYSPKDSVKAETICSNSHKIGDIGIARRKLNEKILAEEEHEVEKQLDLNKKTIAQLEVDLKRSMAKTREEHDARSAAEVQLAELKRIIQQQFIEITPSMITSSSFSSSAESQIQENLQMTDTLFYEERRSWEARVERVDKLEEQLLIAGDKVLRLLENIEKLEENVKTLQKENEKLSGERHEVNRQVSEGSDENCSRSSPDREDILPDRDSQRIEERGQADDSQGRSGQKWTIFATSSKFFEVNWNEEFTRHGKSLWICSKCSRRFRSERLIEDHVWSVHYGETFRCPHCVLRPRCYKGRSRLLKHIGVEHCIF